MTLKSSAFLCALFLVCLAVLPISPAVCRAEDWNPPPPTGNDGFDWIELKSGEWLKGRIKSMQQEKLEFDSEKLDIRTWDWEDIRTVRSPRLLSILFVENEVVDGALLVTGEEVQVVNQAGTHTFPRAKLLAITPTGSHERDRWSGDVTVGINSRQGNTNDIANNTRVTLRRQTPRTRQTLEYLGNYGKLDGAVNKDDQRWSLKADFFLSRRFFIRALDLEHFHDSQQNLAYRLTIGSSFGYYPINTPRTEWQLTAGPAYQKNKYDAVETAASNTEQSLALVLGTRFDTELTSRLDFALEYRGQFAKRAAGGNMHHTLSTLEFEIHKRLTLDLSFTWDRVAAPETDENGVTPLKDDFQSITSLGIHF